MDLSNGKKWVDVVFPNPPLQKFTYLVPDRFQQELFLGHRVLVPLGNRKMTGFVVNFVEQPGIHDLREVEDILDPYPLLTSELMELTRWVAEYYLSSWGEVIRAALPPGIHRKSKLIIKAVENTVQTEESVSETQRTILSSLKNKKKISLLWLGKKLGKKGIRFEAMALEKKGLVHIEQILEEPRVKIRSETWVSLVKSLSNDEIQSITKRAPRQGEVLRTLIESGGESRRSDLKVDISVIRRLKENRLVKLWKKEIFRDAYQGIGSESSIKINLTEEQKEVLLRIDNEIKKKKFNVFLLHGVTSSGKTQVYIEAIRKVLTQGKTALVLIPEISLTPQAVQRYRGAFGNEVAVLHSKMSSGERYDSWRKIREGKFKIALGPRSAVFAPLENLGLIVVDEEHENSYKQTDPAPRYNARDVAVVRGKLNNCVVILGSATPSLESYSNALKGKYTLCQLTQRIDKVSLPEVILVDQKNAGKGNDNRVLSPFLQQKMKEYLGRGEQIILLQNRRGYATFLQCKACGTVLECPNCAISLTYHRKGHKLQCHYCGFEMPAPEVCPKCGGATLDYKGIGTQQVEEEVLKFFPQSRLFRMDRDTMKRKDAHKKIVTEFEKRKGDILLGTQMVAKGHDFPGVNLVGVISADTGLYFPDFRSGEKTFQLLTQAAGRAGRRNVRGKVVIQTLHPENPVLQFVIAQDYAGFYKWVIGQRKELNYPPWGRLILVRFKGEEEERVAEAARFFAELPDVNNFIELLGPSFAPLSRIKGMYRYQVIFRVGKDKDPSGKVLRKSVRDALALFYEKVRFPGVRISVDVDPIDML